MSKKEIIKQYAIAAEIYDLNLSQKILQAFVEDMPTIDADLTLGLDIVFDKSVYQKVEFHQYPIAKEHKGPQPRTEQEKRRQRIYDTLSDQLDKVVAAMEQIGVRFTTTAIIGDDTGSDQIQILVCKEEPLEIPKGKKKTPFKVNLIMPDRPYIHEQAAKVLAEMMLKDMREGKLKEIARKNHMPNWVSADALFAAIANSLHSDASTAELVKSTFISEAFIASDWPLHIRSKTKNDNAESISATTQVDCPEYMLFRLSSGGWEIKKIADLKEAQRYISKHGFTSKYTRSIVVLHNLAPTPYTLFAETEEGLAMITPEEAHVYKKIHVSWNKKE